MGHLPRPAFPDQAPPFVPYMGRRDASPPRMYHNLGSSFHKFEPVGGFPPHDERSAFLHGVHRPGIPPHGYDRMPSSAPWGPQVCVCFLYMSPQFYYLLGIELFDIGNVCNISDYAFPIYTYKIQIYKYVRVLSFCFVT